MDDNKDQQPQTTPVSSAPVMDIQPPQPPVTTAPPTPQEVSPAPPVTEGIPSSSPSNDPSPLAAVSDPAATTEPAVPAPAPHHAHHMPMGPVLAAIVIGLLLVVFAVFAFMKSSKTDSSMSGTPKKTTAQTTTTPAVTANDVTQTSEQLDKDLGTVDDNADFGANDLSDSSLSL